MKTTLRALALCAVTLFPTAANADRLNLCDGQSPSARHTGRWVLDVSYRQPGGGLQPGLKQLQIAAIDFGGFAPGGGGMAQITDGTSNTVFVAEKTVRTSCTDVDGDGIAGIGLIEIDMRNVETGAITTVRIIPVDNELDENGEEEVLIVIGDTTVNGRTFMIVVSGPNGPPSGG